MTGTASRPKRRYTGPWCSYVPATTIAALSQLLRTGGFFYVEYPDPTGDANGNFEVDFPEMKIFCFKEGVAVWHDVTLKMTAQEVS